MSPVVISFPLSKPLFSGEWGSPREKKMCGRQEKRRRQAEFPRWREEGETGKITKHYATFHNRKNGKRREPTEIGWEPGLKGT